MVVDDTNRPQFDTSPWPWVVSKTYPTPSHDQCSAVKKEEVSYCEVSCVQSGRLGRSGGVFGLMAAYLCQLVGAISAVIALTMW